MSQTPPGNEAVTCLPRTSPITLLIGKAKAAGTKEGARAYSEHLIKMFVYPQVGNAYIRALSRRLAMADLTAREGKRSWIPEGSVAQAFNDLMKQAADNSGRPLETNASVVHQLRLALYSGSPHLSSVDSHSFECLPSEAILVIVQLFVTDGAATRPDLSPTPRAHRAGEVTIRGRKFPTARSLVFRYAASHSRSETVKLYDNLAHNLGF